MSGAEGLLVPEFSLDEHPVVIARKFQEIISGVEPETGDEIASYALDVITGLKRQSIPRGYSFVAETVYVTDRPLDDAGPIHGGMLYGDSDLSGSDAGFHYLRTDFFRSICLSVSGALVWSPDELGWHVEENPDLPVHLPVLAVKSIARVES